MFFYMIWKVYLLNSILENVNGYVNVNVNIMVISGRYHPPYQADICCFNNLDKAFDTYSNYEKRSSIGDFNTEISEPRIESFF